MKFTVKEKVVGKTVGKAKHTTDGCQTRINSQKVKGTMFCNMVIGFQTIHEIWVTWRRFDFKW